QISSLFGVIQNYKKTTEDSPEGSRSVDYVHPSGDLKKVMSEVLHDDPEESFCFLNEGRLRERARALQDHFLPENEFRRIIYAVKANSRSRILQVLAKEGVDGFDCASSDEINNVLSQAPEAKILFNNPIRTSKSIRHAMERGVKHFTVQAREDIEDIFEVIFSKYSAWSSFKFSSVPEISVRLQTLNDEAKINLSEKFGATEAATRDLLRFLKEMHRLISPGLSIHTGSQNTSVPTFEKGIELMTHIARTEGGVGNINIGGGIPVNYFDPDQFDMVNYLKRISQSIRDNIKGVLLEGTNEPKIIIELGRAIVAESVDLTIPVLKIEERDGQKCVYINDGVFTSFSDSPVHGWKYNFKAINSEGEELSGGSESCVVFGRTCDSGDTLGRVNLPENLKKGDYLWVENAGAYLDSQSSHFNGFRPPKYVTYNIN
ncbi:hypothetical protein KAR91_25210, partial [Candidatus Pacearchaeota archaeon]|nr:hypothetical protein [Candidatus Pacearchaeota archaeon]